jgi:hypothetical protein
MSMLLLIDKQIVTRSCLELQSIGASSFVNGALTKSVKTFQRNAKCSHLELSNGINAGDYFWYQKLPDRSSFMDELTARLLGDKLSSTSSSRLRFD